MAENKSIMHSKKFSKNQSGRNYFININAEDKLSWIIFEKFKCKIRDENFATEGRKYVNFFK